MKANAGILWYICEEYVGKCVPLTMLSLMMRALFSVSVPVGLPRKDTSGFEK